MKKFTKVILGMMLAVMFGTILGSSPADASERSVGDRYDGRRVSIRSVMNTNRVVDWNQTHPTEVIMYNNNRSWNQEWRMSYQRSNDSYMFMTGGNPGNGRAAFMAARNGHDTRGNRLMGVEFTTLGAMQWRLHHLGRHAQGDVYVLQNIAHGTVLDVSDENVNRNSSLILYPRHNKNNQRFILHVLD